MKRTKNYLRTLTLLFLIILTLIFHLHPSYSQSTLDKRFFVATNHTDKYTGVRLIENGKIISLNSCYLRDNSGLVTILNLFDIFPYGNLFYNCSRNSIYNDSIEYFYDGKVFMVELANLNAKLGDEHLAWTLKRIDTTFIRNDGPRAYEKEQVKKLDSLWSVTNDPISNSIAEETYGYIKNILSTKELTEKETICINEGIACLIYMRNHRSPANHFSQLNEMFHDLFERKPYYEPVKKYLFRRKEGKIYAFIGYDLIPLFSFINYQDKPKSYQYSFIDNNYPLNAEITFLIPVKSEEGKLAIDVFGGQSHTLYFPSHDTISFKRDAVSFRSYGFSIGWAGNKTNGKEGYGSISLGYQFNFQSSYELNSHADAIENKLSSDKYYSHGFLLKIEYAFSILGIHFNPYGKIIVKAPTSKGMEQYALNTGIVIGASLGFPIYRPYEYYYRKTPR